MSIEHFSLDDHLLLAQFYNLAEDLYRDVKGAYPEQANRINTLFFIKGFLLTNHENALARCVLYNPKMMHQNKPLLFFGNFEARDRASGIKLLHSVRQYVTAHYPAYEWIGPVNGSTWNDYRISLDVNSLLFPNDICSATFYPEILTTCGFEILYHYHTNVQTRFETQKHFKPVGFRATHFSKATFEKSLPEIFHLTMAAFENAPLFFKLSESQFIEKQKQLLPAMHMNLITFILDEHEQICGYAFCYPGFEQDTLVIKTVARKIGRRYAGLGRMLRDEVMKVAKAHGIKKIFHAFMHEENASNILSANINGKRIKNYALYRYGAGDALYGN